MSELNQILDSFDAVDVGELFAKPVERESEPNLTPPPTTNNDFNTSDFDQPDVSSDLDLRKSDPEDNEEPYDVDQNAESLVYGINAITAPILTTTAYLKLVQITGGREVRLAIREAEKKQLLGEELTEKDKRLINSREIFDKKLDQLSEAAMASDKKIDRQIRAAKPYVKKKKPNVPEGMAFWGEIVSDLVESVTKILIM